MTFQYSKELVQECIKVFKEDHGLDISEETATEYLDSFANLYLAFSRPNDKKKESE